MGLTDVPTSFGSSFLIRTFFPASLATAIYSLAFYDVLRNSFWFGLSFENKILILIIISLIIGILLNIFDLYIYQFYEGIFGWPDFIKKFFYNRQIKKFTKLDTELKTTEKLRNEFKNSDGENQAKFWMLTKKSRQLSAELRKFPYNPRNNRYLFCWNEIPGKESRALKDFLVQNFGVKWVKNSNIEKLENDMIIKMSFKNHTLLLKLNDDKTNVNLSIDDGRTDEFIVKTDSSKINIYYNSYTERYPENPTEFGNIMAEYELYSRNQYEMHMMVFWQHIWLIMPKELREDLDMRSAKADFNVYISFILLTFAFVGTSAFIYQQDSWCKILYWYIPLKALISAALSILGWYIFYKLSVSEHKTYGRYVKAIFDIYRFELAKKMNIVISDFPEIEKETWKQWKNFLLDYKIPEK